MSKWFKTLDYKKLKIKRHKSASEVSKILNEILIDDSNYVKAILDQINRLPLQGSKMIDMGPNAEYTTLEFFNDDQSDRIEIYNQNFKLPDSSFVSQKNELEKTLLSLIEMHFSKPEYNKPIPFIQNYEYVFNDFKVKYIGFENRTPKNTTATAWTNSFLVTNLKDQSTQTIVIWFGQLPPRPEEFKVNDKVFVLITFSDAEFKQLSPFSYLIRTQK